MLMYDPIEEEWIRVTISPEQNQMVDEYTNLNITYSSCTTLILYQVNTCTANGVILSTSLFKSQQRAVDFCNELSGFTRYWFTVTTED